MDNSLAEKIFNKVSAKLRDNCDALWALHRALVITRQMINNGWAAGDRAGNLLALYGEYKERGGGDTGTPLAPTPALKCVAEDFAALPEDVIKAANLPSETALWCLLNTASRAECVKKAEEIGDADAAEMADSLAGLLYVCNDQKH